MPLRRRFDVIDPETPTGRAALTVMLCLAVIIVVGAVFLQTFVAPALAGKRLALVLLESERLEVVRARAGQPVRTFAAADFDALVEYLRTSGYPDAGTVPRIERAVYDLYRMPLTYECIVVVYVDGKRVAAVVLKT